MHRSLLLLRHGRTAWNVEGRGQGQTDVPLDQVGREQARAAGAAVAAFRPAAVWSSDSSRAYDTAVCIGQPVQADARLREIALGTYEGRTMSDWEQDDPETFHRWRAGYDVQRGGGECYSDVAARVVPALQDAWGGMSDPTGLLVVVSHGGAIRALLTAVLELPPAPWARLAALGNCCCALLADSEDGRGLRLITYGVPPQALPRPGD